ncbi:MULTISPECIES: AfsR/SARP family transcriptional regulator [Saccharothrix]|uniref:AfsR/SARP family transcriptional regulator n=1 Tax=Saccharothrix TaxID=2071 RepID=UPI000938AA5A|nr:BTAD domain-containing putative transcriptional regulator [Saccharothrix sp. CB00851]OKI20299.1 transcriptional regulator, SARP family protein [Saccharothrix sp. CB00851]
MGVRFQVLGHVEVRVDGAWVDLGHARQRSVLAVLAVEANQVVATDQVVDRVWGERPPRRARQLVSNYLSHLRRLLAAGGITDEVVVQRRGGGYVLLVDPECVDVHRFRRLVTDARAELDQSRALALLKQACELWRGEALAGLDTPWTTSVRGGLERERFAADTDRLDLALRAGQHAALLPELTERAAAHPLDEHVVAQLMLALHRAGRQADALDHYRRLRTRLADHLGTDPGADLRQLHQRILTADPALTAATVGTDRSRVVPRQLPGTPRAFTGREPELAMLDRAASEDGDPRTDPGATTRTVVISAIGGAGGIGKTWLALTWAHRNLHRFPDGQLFVDLQGFSPAGRPIDPADALRGFLTALGVGPGALPADLAAKAALYRSLVTDKRMLVVLDNAAAMDQVVPLLPGGASCTVLVTSRTKLASLIDRHGAHHVPLDVLTPAEARALLAARLGDQRVDADRAVTEELIRLCGCYPLALSITARHAATRPRIPLTEIAAELRDQGMDMLDNDDDPTASLPMVLSWSLRGLTDHQRMVFALLAITPGPDVELPAAAALTGLTEAQTRKALLALENHSLLDRRPDNRYAMHDLVRAHAATTHLPEPVRQVALERVVDFYLHTARAADHLLYPQRPSAVQPVPPTAGVRPRPLPDRPAALAWMDAHHPHLLAAQRTAAADHRHEAVWHLAWALSTFHMWRGHRHDDLTVWQAAVNAAEHLPDLTSRIHARWRLGHAHAELGRHEQAITYLHDALTLAEHHEDRIEQARIHHALAWTREQQGNHLEALTHARRALVLYRELDQPVWEADALNTVGWLAAHLGEHDTARDHCQAALVLHRRNQDADGEANTLDSLGYIDQHTGRHRQAIDHYQQAVTLYHTVGNTPKAAETLNKLGHSHAALGQRQQAQAAWQQALTLYRRLGRDTDAQRVQQQLADLTHEPPTARPPDGR